jgi:hypothetical protein
MKVLNQIGFRWHENGAIVSVTVDGQKMDVFVPLTRLTVEFGDALARVGCPLAPAVGWEPYSVGGLFSRIKRAVKKGVKTAVKVHKMPHNLLVKKLVPRAIRSRAMAIRRAATQHVKRRVLPFARQLKTQFQSPYARYAAMALTAIPVTAPIGGSMMAAQNTMSLIDRGQKAAQLVQRGIRRPGDIAAMMEAASQKQNVAQLASLARGGNPQAQAFFGALNSFAR